MKYRLLVILLLIKSNETGLIGQREGGVVASIAAGQREAVKFVVMLGAPEISLRKAFEPQTELQYKKGEISKERYDFYMNIPGMQNWFPERIFNEISGNHGRRNHYLPKGCLGCPCINA